MHLGSLESIQEARVALPAQRIFRALQTLRGLLIAHTYYQVW